MKINLLKPERIKTLFNCRFIYVMFLNLMVISCTTEINETLATTHKNCTTDNVMCHDDRFVEESSNKILEILKWIDTGLLLVVLITFCCVLCCFCSIMHIRRSRSN